MHVHGWQLHLHQGSDKCVCMHAAGAAAWLPGQGGSHWTRHSPGNPGAAEAQPGRHYCRQELCHPGQPCLSQECALHTPQIVLFVQQKLHAGHAYACTV